MVRYAERDLGRYLVGAMGDRAFLPYSRPKKGKEILLGMRSNDIYANVASRSKLLDECCCPPQGVKQEMWTLWFQSVKTLEGPYVDAGRRAQAGNRHEMPPRRISYPKAWSA